MFSKKQYLLLLSLLIISQLRLFSQTIVYTKEVKAKMRQVEEGLSGWLLVSGEPKWTLKERMRFYNIKGLSIAVIRNFQVEWAKGYGMADTIGKQSVTDKTFFQATSLISTMNTMGVLKLVDADKAELAKDTVKTTFKSLIERISKQKYPKYLAKNIFEPVGMSSSFLNNLPAASKKVVIASGYSGDGKEFKASPGKPGQADDFRTNPSDLAKLVIELQLSLEGKSNKILSKEMMGELFKQGSKQANGLRMIDKPDQRWMHFSGSTDGFTTAFYGSTREGNGVVMMMNGDYNEILLTELANSVASTYNWGDFYKPVVKPNYSASEQMLQSYTGKYEMSTNEFITITKVDNHLQVQAGGAVVYDVFPESEIRFFSKMKPVEVLFIKNVPRKIDMLVYTEMGKSREAKKVIK